MSNTVRVEFTIQAEHIDQWEAIAEALCRGPAGVEVQEMLDQLAPGSGELVEAGPCAEVIDAPKQDYTRRLVQAALLS